MTSLSLVVPVRDEERHLPSFLASLGALRWERGPVEVLLLEGRSRDATRAMLQSARIDRPGWTLRLLDNPSGDIPSALNLGIQASRGDVIVRLDAHTLFPEDYLERLVDALGRTGAANAGGVVLAAPGAETATARAIARARSDLFGAGNTGFRTGFSSGPRRTVPFGCFPRETFRRYGPFDPRLLRNQDIEMNGRIRARGGLVWQEGSVVSRYLAPATFGALVRKHLANGEWNVYATAVRPGCLSRLHAAPGLFLLLAALSPLLHPLALPLILLLQVSGNAARALLKGPGVSRPRLALAFCLIQWGHGLGQAKGVLMLPRFLRRGSRSSARRSAAALSR